MVDRGWGICVVYRGDGEGALDRGWGREGVGEGVVERGWEI